MGVAGPRACESCEKGKCEALRGAAHLADAVALLGEAEAVDLRVVSMMSTGQSDCSEKAGVPRLSWVAHWRLFLHPPVLARAAHALMRV